MMFRSMALTIILFLTSCSASESGNTDSDRTASDGTDNAAPSNEVSETQAVTAQEQPSSNNDLLLTSEDVASSQTCALDLRELRRLGCVPSDPGSCIDPATGQPYCGVANWLNDFHERDPRFSEALDILKEPEIIGGKDVPLYAYLETVLITPDVNLIRPLCSGVLIHPGAVLTARHCVQDGTAIDGSSVRFGREFDGPIHLSVVASVSVPDSIGMVNSDIAILWLSQPVPEFIRPATIASANDIDSTAGDADFQSTFAKVATIPDAKAAKAARVVGFGLTEQRTYGTKLYADLAVVTANCDAGFTDRRTSNFYTDMEFYGCDENQELVAGAVRTSGAFSVDTCSGDSGGPVFVVNAESALSGKLYKASIKPQENPLDVSYRLAGITSRAVETEYIPAGDMRCGNGGIYERISGANLAWLQTELAERGHQLSMAQND